MSRPILLAEDSEDDAILIQATLKKAEVLNPVLAVSDGAQAIAYLKGEKFYADRNLFPLPGVILLDLKMPNKTGFDVFGVVESPATIERHLDRGVERLL